MSNSTVHSIASITDNHAKSFGEFEERRIYMERLQANYSGWSSTSFHPAYAADEVDDGRLDQRRRSTYIRGDHADQVIDENEGYVPDEDDILDLKAQSLAAALADAKPQPPNPRSPRSTRNYPEEIHQRLRNMLPLKNVQVIVRGKGLVPYKPVPYKGPYKL